MSNPLADTVLNTRPKIPKGARLMIQLTTRDVPSAMSARTFLVVSFAVRRASPRRMAVDVQIADEKEKQEQLAVETEL